MTLHTPLLALAFDDILYLFALALCVLCAIVVPIAAKNLFQDLQFRFFWSLVAGFAISVGLLSSLPFGDIALPLFAWAYFGGVALAILFYGASRHA